jgi:hypothetical protein
MTRLLVVLIALLQGCTTSSGVFLADGSKGYQIQCGAIVGQNYGDCLAKAGNLCGARGYTVVRQESNNVFVDSIFVKCNAP